MKSSIQPFQRKRIVISFFSIKALREEPETTSKQTSNKKTHSYHDDNEKGVMKMSLFLS